MYLKWINNWYSFSSFKTGIKTRSRKKKPKLNSFKVLLNNLRFSDTEPKLKVPFHDSPRQLASPSVQSRAGPAPWLNSSASHLFPNPRKYFVVVCTLKQMSPSCWVRRHSSLSSGLLRDGPCIPMRGPGDFIPAGRAAVHQPAPVTSPCLIHLFFPLFPAWL